MMIKFQTDPAKYGWEPSEWSLCDIREAEGVLHLLLPNGELVEERLRPLNPTEEYELLNNRVDVSRKHVRYGIMGEPIPFI